MLSKLNRRGLALEERLVCNKNINIDYSEEVYESYLSASNKTRNQPRFKENFTYHTRGTNMDG